MRMEKISYRSRAGDIDIPAFVFQPLKLRGAKGHPAIVWVHENIRGHLYEHYIPYIREATAKGYIVIAPEYRGSIGYGKAFYDAIDYGGHEVDDRQKDNAEDLEYHKNEIPEDKHPCLLKNCGPLKLLERELPGQDSNLDKENQNLLCYRYTTGYRRVI